MEIKIGLFASGAVLLDGQRATIAHIDTRLAHANPAEDQVLYYKEHPVQTGAPQSMEILKLVMKYRLPVSLSSKPDYSDYVDQSGQLAPRPGAMGSEPNRFAPFMPDVNLRRNVQDVFLEARNAAAKLGDGRGITLIGPDRAVMVFPAPPRSPESDARLPKIPHIPSGRPRTIAVIGNTGTLAVAQGKAPGLQEASKVIPFLGLLMALGYAGHRVWMFEGHASALAAGLEHAEILVLDSGMRPFLQKDWMFVAQGAMDPPCRVLIHERERFAMLPAYPAATPQGWSYSEPAAIPVA